MTEFIIYENGILAWEHAELVDETGAYGIIEEARKYE